MLRGTLSLLPKAGSGDGQSVTDCVGLRVQWMVCCKCVCACVCVLRAFVRVHVSYFSEELRPHVDILIPGRHRSDFQYHTNSRALSVYTSDVTFW